MFSKTGLQYACPKPLLQGIIVMMSFETETSESLLQGINVMTNIEAETNLNQCTSTMFNLDTKTCEHKS